MSTTYRLPQTAGGLTNSRKPVGARHVPVVALQAECRYGLEEPDGSRFGDNEPVLGRFVRCRAMLPADTPLQNAARVIAMFKCFRRMDAGKGAAQPAAIETLFTKFSRVWPAPDDPAAGQSPLAAGTSTALIVHSTNTALDFRIPLPADLPQSVSVPGGALYYTVQIQANLRGYGAARPDEVIFSAELLVEVPPPRTAYSTNRLPKRITHGVVGQAQEHYGILVSPDISLHVSVPREISYSRRMHSVFKIHLKLMPHPPEAKLPPLAKLEWKLTQRTNLGSIRMDGNQASRPINTSSAELATGQIVIPAGQETTTDAMGVGRKDHYLYIAMPQDSAALLPMYDGNKYLEILHQLEIELFLAAAGAHRPAGPPGSAGSNHGGGGGGSVLRSFFAAAARPLKRAAGRADLATRGGGGGSHHAPTSYRAEIPIKLFFDVTELSGSVVVNNNNTVGGGPNGAGAGSSSPLSAISPKLRQEQTPRLVW